MWLEELNLIFQSWPGMAPVLGAALQFASNAETQLAEVVSSLQFPSVDP